MITTTTAPDPTRFFTVEFHFGTEVDPSARQIAAEKRLADARAKLAAGQFLVADGSSQMSLMDPAYFSRSFRPMRWMQPEHIAAARRVPLMAVGETLTLARDFHPRHGVKTRTVTRLA